jgi:hypothetical protein
MGCRREPARVFVVLEKESGSMSFVVSRHFGVKVCLVLGAWFAASASLAQSAPAVTYPRPMTASEKQDFDYLLPKLGKGQPYVLNLAEPHQQSFARRGLQLAQRTPQNAPQTYAAFQAAVRAHAKKAKGTTSQPVGSATATAADDPTGPQPITSNITGDTQEIAAITYPRDGGDSIYAAVGLSSVFNGTTQTTITTQLIDTQSGVIYASASNTQYGQGTAFYVTAAGKVPNATYLAAVATITTVVNDVASTVVVSTASATPASTATMTAPNYCVRTKPNDLSSDCVITDGQTQYQTTSTTLVPNPTPIRICFVRGSQQACDYYDSTARPAYSIFFPEAGTAGFGSSTIDASTYSTLGYYTAMVFDPMLGGGCVFASGQPLDPAAGWSLANGNTTLQWNMAQLSTYNFTKCMSTSSGRTMNFIFTVSVPLASGSSGFVSFSSDYTPPAPAGYYGVPQLYLEDSCVAAGTMVRLADGGEAAIEALSADQSPWVRTATGDKRKVLGTSKGMEMHPMVRIRTSLGQGLLITRTHPVLTTSGLVMARDLKVGERVRTEKGVATIVSAATEAYSGQVHSLRLGWFDERKSDRRTHTANGIFIGDSITQQQLEQEDVARLQSDKAHVAKRLPSDKWRAEYRQYLMK